MNAGALHFHQCILHVGGAKIDAPTGVLDHISFETEFEGVQSRELDAIVRREPTDENLIDAFFLKPFAETGGFAVAVVEEGAVAIDARVGALFENPSDPVLFQSRSESGLSFDPQLKTSTELERWRPAEAVPMGRETRKKIARMSSGRTTFYLRAALTPVLLQDSG